MSQESTITISSSSSTESKSIGEASSQLASSVSLGSEQLQNLHQTASLCLKEGNFDEAIELYETVLSSLPSSSAALAMRQSVLRGMAHTYHARSRQQQDEGDWLFAQQAFEEAIQCKPDASLYCEYAHLLYLKGVRQREKRWFEQAVVQLMQALTTDEEGSLSHSWIKQEIIPLCAEFSTSISGDTLEANPRVLAQYLLVSCYCQLEARTAKAALEELQQKVESQATNLSRQLLAVAQAEYTKFQQAQKEKMEEAKAIHAVQEELTVVIPKLNVRAQGDFKALPERQRPGGSSADLQFFKEVSSEKLWIGKCGNNAMSLPPARVPYYAHYYEEYKEWLGLMLYRLLGIDVPQIALSEQLPVKPEKLVDIFDYERPCLHVMLEFVDGFHTYGDGFLDHYRKTATGRKDYATVVSAAGGIIVPLQGFGATLAVACFLYDLDCLGRSGGNMGYVVTADSTGQLIAKTIKIDPGFAFSFLENFADTSYNHDPRQRDVRFAPGKMAGGQTCIIRYDELSSADQAEFAQAARRILQTPRATFKAVIDQVVVPKGFTRQQADRLLDELLARKSLFLNGFAPEVDSQLKAEVRTAREVVLARLMAKKDTLPTEPQVADSKADSKQTSSSSAESFAHFPITPAWQSVAMTGDSDEPTIETKEGPVVNKSKLKPSPILSGSSLSASSFSSTWTATRSTTPLLPETKESKATASGDIDLLLTEQAAAESKIISLAAQLEKERIRGEKPDTKSGCQVFQKPAVNAYFTGREAILANVAQQLHAGQGSVITQGISGLGGVGKTQIAARYAQLASEGAMCGEQRLQYQAVIWLNAEYNLDIQFLMLAEAWCNRTGLKPMEAIAMVYRHLKNKRTLLVFDNAVDKASIAPFLPPTSAASSTTTLRTASLVNNLHVLITSRNSQWQEVPTLNVNGFSPEEAATFVRKRLPTATDAEIAALVETVSTLPLALSHAVAYIAEGHSTIADYPRQFALHQLSLGSATTQTDASHTVLTTFLLTFFRLKQEHPIVVPILYACAYLAPDNIAVDWLETAFAGPETAKGGCKLGKFPLAEVQAALAALQRHALLQSEKPGMLNIHRLLQQVVRHQLNVMEQQSQVGRVLEWLTTANPAKGGNHTADQAWGAFLPHLEAVIEYHDQNNCLDNVVLATALDQSGRIYQHLLGQPAKRRSALERALQIKEAHYGQNDYETAITLRGLGAAYWALGDISKSRDLAERTLQIQEAYYGSDHYETADALEDLGISYGDLGNMGKKRDLLERALKIKEAHYGPDHCETAGTLMNLGSAYGSLGDAVKARELLERALRLHEAHYGSDHHVTAVTLMNLGAIYDKALGDVHKTREFSERALKIQEAHYGPDHYAIAGILGNLGNVYGELGDVGKKRDFLERALRIQEAHYGSDHYQTAGTLNSLGSVCRALGDFNKARELYERALRIQEAHYGSDHYETAATLGNLGAICDALGDTAKARDLLERALRIREAHYGSDHYETAPILSNLGAIYDALGDTAKARDLLERALRIQEVHYGPDHYEIAGILGNLGNVYGELGDVGKKRDFLERALRIREAHYGSDHYETAATLGNLGAICDALGDTAKARDLLERALRIQEAHYGRDHYETVVVLVNLGIVYDELGDLGKARDLLERALRIREAHYGSDHYQTAAVLVNLGMVYDGLGNSTNARDLLESALRIQEIHYGPDHYRMVSTLDNLAGTYFTLGDLGKAGNLFERSLRIQEAHYGPMHPHLALTLTNLALVYHKLKQPQAAFHAAQRVCQNLVNHPDFGSAHPQTKQCLKSLQAIGFTLAMFQQGGGAVSGHKQPATFPLENTVITNVSSLPASQTPANLEQLQVLYQIAISCHRKGDLDKAIQAYVALFKLPLTEAEGRHILHNLACVYHARSHQQHSKNDWLRAQQLFEKAVAIKPEASTYCEYAQFLYLQGEEQFQKGWFEQAVIQLTFALTANEEWGLSYSWAERETVPACLRFLLNKPEDTFNISPKLLAQYLLVSCYCHLRQLPEAGVALSELEKRASGQTTDLPGQLLSAAQAEYAKCQQTRQEEIRETKTSDPDSTHFQEKAGLTKPELLSRGKEPQLTISVSPLTAPSSPSLFSAIAFRGLKKKEEAKPPTQASNLLQEVFDLLDQVYSANDIEHGEIRENYLLRLVEFQQRQAVLTPADGTVLEQLRAGLQQQLKQPEKMATAGL